MAAGSYYPLGMACEERQFVGGSPGASKRASTRNERIKEGSNPAGPSFGLGALLLVFALVGVCIALGRIDPLLAIVAAGMSAAGLMRTSRIVSRSLASGRTMGNGAKLVAFFASVGTLLAAMAAMVFAAGLAGAAAWLAGRCLDVAFRETWISIVTSAWGMVIGLGVGMFAAERVLTVQRSA